MRERYQSSCSVVGKVNKHVVFTGSLQYSASSGVSDCALVPFQHCPEVFGGDCQFGIVQFDSMVDIHSWVFEGGLIEHLTSEGVGDVGGDVVVGEGDDSVGVETSFDHELVGVVDVCLVSIVGVGA